jgi:hypothetical protein
MFIEIFLENRRENRNIARRTRVSSYFNRTSFFFVSPYFASTAQPAPSTASTPDDRTDCGIDPTEPPKPALNGNNQPLNGAQKWRIQELSPQPVPSFAPKPITGSTSSLPEIPPPVSEFTLPLCTRRPLGRPPTRTLRELHAVPATGIRLLSTPFHEYGNVFHNPKRQRGDPSLTLGLYRHHGIRCHTYEMVYLVKHADCAECAPRYIIQAYRGYSLCSES